MIAFKCKMCGGDLNIAEGSNVCECAFCGTQQTIPSADNEKKVNLFNRANRLRMNAEFDKAAAVYASITAEFPEEAEAYWGLCLCKYGIEYVDDPLTGNKIPTCHRTLPESIMDDSDFDQACENADAESKRLYREESKAIDRLQQDILNIVAAEEPYDVFICYKETDENGERTEDSVLAQSVYDELTSKNLKVFFARITLEDKLGKQYEPYIYAALHSAKVMLSIGTQFEYFDAVWVKNEWSRFLELMKADRTKTLIPCYKGLDAYDMPREFKNLQAQDMGKLGWLQDLTRGVLKLCQKDGYQQKQMVVQNTQGGSPTIDSLLRRAMVFIEDRQWDEAKQYADRVLDLEVENGQAYLIKLMADLKTSKEEEIKELQIPFDDNANYKKIIRFGDEELKFKMEGYASVVRKAKETLDQKISNIKSKYEADQQAYEEKQAAYKDCMSRLQYTEKQIEQINRDIISKQKEKENLVGLFNKKRRNELQLHIDNLHKQLTDLERKKQLSEEMYPDVVSQVDPPSKEAYYYEIATVYFEAKRYEEAYKYYNQIRGYAGVSSKIQVLSTLIPNVDLDPDMDSIIRILSQCKRASEMIKMLNELGLSHECITYMKIMEVLKSRAAIERMYGTNYNETMTALKKLKTVAEKDAIIREKQKVGIV